MGIIMDRSKSEIEREHASLHSVSRPFSWSLWPCNRFELLWNCLPSQVEFSILPDGLVVERQSMLISSDLYSVTFWMASMALPLQLSNIGHVIAMVEQDSARERSK